MESIFICQICGEKIYQKHLVQYHTKKHKITHKEYYDTYLKNNKDGICPVCGKNTKFLSLWLGYSKHCSTRCSTLDPNVQKKIQQTNLIRYNTINGYNTKLTGIHKQIIKRPSLTESRQQSYSNFEKQNNCIRREFILEKYGWMWYWAKIIDLLFYKNKAFVRLEDIPKIEKYIEETAKNNRSHIEIQLLQYVQSIYKGTIIHNCKSIITPKELDIYLPNLQLAIEFNGVYWHSSKMGTPINAHLEKSQLCHEKGIRLIHIYEFEDLEQQKQLLKDLIENGIDNYNPLDYNKNNLLDGFENIKPEIVYEQNDITIYGVGKLY